MVSKIAENYKLPYYTLSPTYSVCKNHGYINGEVYECPDCGAKTEVYSRITGYYRPVQNWNDGKAQEFKDRKLYDIDNSRLRRNGRPEEKAGVSASRGCSGESVTLLFTTKTCPNCKMAKTFLDKAGVNYRVVDAEEEPELVKQFGVTQAPTLVVAEGENYDKYVNASNIKRFTENCG